MLSLVLSLPVPLVLLLSQHHRLAHTTAEISSLARLRSAARCLHASRRWLSAGSSVISPFSSSSLRDPSDA